MAKAKSVEVRGRTTLRDGWNCKSLPVSKGNVGVATVTDVQLKRMPRRILKHPI